MYHNNEINLLEEYLKRFPDTSLFEACEDIKNQYQEYNNGKEYFTSNYKKTMEDAFNNFHISPYISYEYGGECRDGDKNDKLRIEEEVEKYRKNLNTLKCLKILSEDKKRIFVMVGPNGCGKTTLLRQLRSATGENKIGYYPSDRLFVIDSSYNPQRTQEALLNEIENTDRGSADIHNNNQAFQITRQMNQTIALFEKIRYKEMDEVQSGIRTDEECFSSQVLEIWNDLIQDRKLFSCGELLISTLDGVQYPINNMSSGEKSIFYFLTNILLKEEKEYYFIDEPENNLNPAIVSKLWNTIEKRRPNSVFVYLTHNNEFATSRINSRNYWIEKYDGENWDFMSLPDSDVLPKDLVVSLVGNRNPVLFCESHDIYKYDCMVYELLFPEYRVIPAGGCDLVTKKVEAYKMVSLPQTAIGIIDADYRSEDQLRGLESIRVYHLPFHEIENFLFCEEIMSCVVEKYSQRDSEEVIKNLKDAVQNDLKAQKERWIIRKIGATLREDQFNKKISQLHSYGELLNEYEDYQSRIDLEMMRKQFDSEIDKAIHSEDYNTYLKYYDNKGILRNYASIIKLPNRIKYEEVVFDELKNNTKLVSVLRSKYFPKL